MRPIPETRIFILIHPHFPSSSHPSRTRHVTDNCCPLIFSLSLHPPHPPKKQSKGPCPLTASTLTQVAPAGGSPSTRWTPALGRPTRSLTGGRTPDTPEPATGGTLWTTTPTLTTAMVTGLTWREPPSAEPPESVSPSTSFPLLPLLEKIPTTGNLPGIYR